MPGETFLIKKGDFLNFTHLDPDGKPVVELITKVVKLNRLTRMATILLPPTDYIPQNNTDVVHTEPPYVRGKALLASEHHRLDGTDIFTKATNVPQETQRNYQLSQK